MYNKQIRLFLYLYIMGSVRDLIKTLKEIKDEIPNIVEQSIKENDVIRLQTSQIEQHKGSDGNELVSKNNKFSGFYKLSTQLISTQNTPLLPKIAGDEYNFIWTGTFINSFHVEKDQFKYRIYNTGTGSGDKKNFFDSFPTIIGLNQENKDKVENIIAKELEKYIKNKLQ